MRRQPVNEQKEELFNHRDSRSLFIAVRDCCHLADVLDYFKRGMA